MGKRCVLGACLEERPDDLEERTFQLAFDKKFIPPGVDLRRWMSPVEDEGQLGTCTASALAGAIEYLVLRETRVHADVSRLFIYYNQRYLRNDVRHDAGATLRDGVRVLHRLGVPHEKMWPYALDLLAVQPPEAVYRAAYDHRVVDYCKVPVQLDALRGCLAGGIPIACGVYVWSTFVDLGPDGVLRAPVGGEQPEGRHALLLVGYLDREQVFIARNSWGTDWGDRGYCYLPYQYVLSPLVTHSCWALRTSADVTFEEAEHVQTELIATPPGAAGATGQPLTAEALFGKAAFEVGASTPAAGGASAPGGPATAGAVAPGPIAAAKPPSLLGSLGAIATGRKSPMDLAFEMATHHSKGLVARWTGSELAGNMVSGVIGHLQPAVQGGQRLDLGTVGGAMVNAAMGGPVPAPGAPAAAPGFGAPAIPGAPPPGYVAHDAGLLRGPDLGPEILRRLNTPPPAVAVKKHHWDDSYDEQAALTADAAGPPKVAPQPAAAVPPPPPAPPAAVPPPAPPAAVPPPAPPAAAPAARPAAAPAGRPRAHQTQVLSVAQISPAFARQAGPAAPQAGTTSGAVPDPRATTSKSGPEQLREHWQALGGANGPLGRVVGGELALSDRKGLGLLCKNGAIVWHPERGPIELVGGIFSAWSGGGAEGGPLGYPVAPELQVTNGAWTAVLARFENGLIVDWVHEGAEEIPPFTLLGGDILYQTWLRAGAERSPAGVPLATPQDVPEHGVRVLPCSNGAIVWTRAAGAQCLDLATYRAWCASLAPGS